MAPGAPGEYPARWENDVVLSDGGIVHVRPVRPRDADRVRAFHARQSRESIYFRYFTPMPTLSERELTRLTTVDYVTRMSFVAMLGDDIVGMASFDVWRTANEAEVAFIIDDEHQGRGVATVLLEYLVVAAREAGLEQLTAQVLPTNRRMLSVFRRGGFETSSAFEDGLVEVRLGLEPTAEAQALIDERERMAEARSMQRLLDPESIAVIGADRSPTGIGHQVLRNLIDGGFDGPVFPVNPTQHHVASVRSYASVLDIPDEVDLAVVAVPAETVLEVVGECARKRVRGLAIISAGLDELSVDGRRLDLVVVERALRHGMRVIGPESLGLINTAPASAMAATFASVDVQPGRVGFVTQSGTLGIAALERARRMGVGISTFVDLGSRLEVSGNDLLQYWSDDDRTAVALLYLESFGNPRKFTRIARRMARTKPIVAVKSGRGGPLPSGVSRRTGTIDQDGADEVVDDEGRTTAQWPIDATIGAMLAQSGVIRVDTPVELFDVARVLVAQPVPAGRRMAVISNAKGATLLTADACTSANLQVASVAELTWRAGADDYGREVRAAMADEKVDAVIVVYAPPHQDQHARVARAIAGAAGGRGKPIVATFLGSPVELSEPLGGVSPSALSGERSIPLFDFPSQAAQVLGRIADYADWLARPQGEPCELVGLDADAVSERIDALLASAPAGRWLERDEVVDLLAELGLPLARQRIVTDLDDALEAAEQLGYPVALKAGGVVRYHPGEGGGVALDLHRPDELRDAYLRMCAGFGEAMGSAVVQEQLTPGVDVLLTGHQHARFGGVVGVGIGGSMALANPSLPIRVLPLTDADADRLVAESPVAALLELEAPDGRATRACRDVLARLGAVLDQVPELADVVLSPLIVSDGRAVPVDAQIRVAPYRTEAIPAVRRLT